MSIQMTTFIVCNLLLWLVFPFLLMRNLHLIPLRQVQLVCSLFSWNDVHYDHYDHDDHNVRKNVSNLIFWTHLQLLYRIFLLLLFLVVVLHVVVRLPSDVFQWLFQHVPPSLRIQAIKRHVLVFVVVVCNVVLAFSVNFFSSSFF